MAADILQFEHFLYPQTMIVVDGRTANVRFLMANLQRDWRWKHLAKEDTHIGWMNEGPLGSLDARRLDWVGDWVP